MRKALLVIAALTVTVSACSRLGLGEADCTPPERDVSSSNILAVQAVPTARYTPCLHEMKLGWDEVKWFARDGEAGIEIFESSSPFLKATVTPSCDIGDATAVPSTRPRIQRFEDVEYQPVEIGITIVPSGQAALKWARGLAVQLQNAALDDRPVELTIDEDEAASITSRVERALAAERYVWIVGELDAEEGTVELRSDDPETGGIRISPADALDLIEDDVPGLFYRGHWYFTFDGGCITYEFNASGTLAETVAADAEDALGFYPAFVLRQLAEDAGFDLVDD